MRSWDENKWICIERSQIKQPVFNALSQFLLGTVSLKTSCVTIPSRKLAKTGTEIHAEARKRGDVEVGNGTSLFTIIICISPRLCDPA